MKAGPERSACAVNTQNNMSTSRCEGVQATNAAATQRKQAAKAQRIPTAGKIRWEFLSLPLEIVRLLAITLNAEDFSWGWGSAAIV